MADLIFIEVTKDELKGLIKETIEESLKQHQITAISTRNEPLLKIDEVCEILRVSRVTINKWKKSGRIPFYRISNRIFFKKSEILESLSGMGPRNAKRR